MSRGIKITVTPKTSRNLFFIRNKVNSLKKQKQNMSKSNVTPNINHLEKKCITKGQFISKGLFAILKFFQKNERNNSIIALKMNSFVCFLEESSARKYITTLSDL